MTARLYFVLAHCICARTCSSFVTTVVTPLPCCRACLSLSSLPAMHYESCMIRPVCAGDRSAASGIHSLCAERLLVRFSCCAGTHARQPQVRAQPSCLQCMSTMSSCILSSQTPAVRAPGIIASAGHRVHVCMCVSLFFVGWFVVRNSHTPSDKAAHAPTRPMQVSAPCLPDCIHACVPRVALSSNLLCSC